MGTRQISSDLYHLLITGGIGHNPRLDALKGPGDVIFNNKIYRYSDSEYSFEVQ